MKSKLTVEPHHRKFFWGWGMECLAILIPRQDGKGWLAAPAGHHSTKRISDIEASLNCDICGLDGYLEIEVDGSISAYLEKRRLFEEKAFPLLEKWYRCGPGREIGIGGVMDTLKASFKRKGLRVVSPETRWKP